LGASNLTLGLEVAVKELVGVFGGPLEIFVAAGHGRSYGAWSRCLARELPGILDCGLWEDLPSPGRLPTYAVVTDVGNDIAYGASPEVVAGWVREVLDRLEPYGAQTVLTQLPLDSLATLGPVRYGLLRTLLFPGRGMTLDEAKNRAVELGERLETLAEQRGTPLVSMPAKWYRADTIHLKTRSRRTAWREILGPFPRSGEASGLTLPFTRLSPRPQHRRWLGFDQHHPQPSLSLPDGSRLWVY
jgi:hypothetical protein